MTIAVTFRYPLGARVRFLCHPGVGYVTTWRRYREEIDAGRLVHLMDYGIRQVGDTDNPIELTAIEAQRDPDTENEA